MDNVINKGPYRTEEDARKAALGFEVDLSRLKKEGVDIDADAGREQADRVAASLNLRLRLWGYPIVVVRKNDFPMICPHGGSPQRGDESFVEDGPSWDRVGEEVGAVEVRDRSGNPLMRFGFEIPDVCETCRKKMFGKPINEKARWAVLCSVTRKHVIPKALNCRDRDPFFPSKRELFARDYCFWDTNNGTDEKTFEERGERLREKCNKEYDKESLARMYRKKL